MTTILIVDDNEQNLYLLETTLKGSAYAVVSARNGAEAFELAKKNPPDLVISDILMPVMDGYELCRRWRAEESLKKIPFIFYTATYIDPKDEKFGLSIGADQFIVKPAKIEVLQEVVREVLEQSRQGKLAAPGRTLAEEEVVLREYNAVLFRKLQDKVLQLEDEVAARKAAQQALERTAEELKGTNQDLADFFYITSHDLRGPLLNIRGFSENMQKYCAELERLIQPGTKEAERLTKLLRENMPEALKYIISSTGNMDYIISGLLRMARAGSLELIPQTVDMEKLAGDTVGSMIFQIKESGAEVQIGKLPPCLGDRTQLGQVFFNLISNSIKYRDPSRKPEITVTGTALPSGASSYTVTDNGRGLTPEEIQGRIWKLFYRADPKISGAGEGAGLTISKRIIEKHGGSIKASAAPGGGAAFTFELPNIKVKNDSDCRPQ
ncbi:MAG TPA: response regulator [Elusimicrobiales bacterium]|nr:response regulator [Elusimicrobiales bacterium]